MRAAPGTLLGAVLAGGEARRFGGVPKGLAEVGGRPILARVVAALRAAGAEPMLVGARAAPFATDALPWHPDAIEGVGALGGVLTALDLAARTARPALVVAWDLPFVSGRLLRALARTGAARGATAVVPVQPDGTAEPLCAWYAAACLTPARRLVAAGERRVGALLEAVGALRLPAHELPGGRWIGVNVNTPADLRRACHLSGVRRTAEHAARRPTPP